jgi:tetratricopeptide (TPR) repeat protein
MFQRSVEGQEKALGAENIDTLHMATSLGIFRKDQGKLVEAEEILQRVLQGYEKALGPESSKMHPTTFRALSALGTLYDRQGNRAEARTMYLEAIKGYEKLVVPSDTLLVNMRRKVQIIEPEVDGSTHILPRLFRMFGLI